MLWIAALVHRLSGLALAIFLPLHFLALGLAIDGEARLEGFLRWSDQPLVKLAESGLVFLLMVHMLGGLRLLVIENLDWRDGQKQLATIAAGVSAVIAFILLARVCSEDRMTLERLKTDILILGSGGAGLFAALHAFKANPDLDVTVATKGLLGKCGCTRMVQGGYNVALNPGDSVERHFMDTIEGGKWLPHQELAWTLVSHGGRARARAGERDRLLLRSQSGRHAARQSLCRPDLRPHRAQGRPHRHRDHQPADGAGVGAPDPAAGRAPRRRARSRRRMATLAGVLMIDIRTGEFRFVAAQAVLLATGGGPTMYRYHTPSGDKSMDGLAMALRAGPAPARHGDGPVPSHRAAGRPRHAHDRHRAGGRACAAPGGHLLNGAMRRFMGDYDDKLERATRDVVSRAIYAEMKAGRTTPNGGVYIKMGHLGPAKVAKEFKGMVDRCRDCGFDLAGGLVEVVPTAHYFMGGVICKADTSTEWPGLFVAGEDASGMHGANRLGGNGVANSTVFGGIAGDVMPRWIAANPGHRAARRGCAGRGDGPRAASLHAQARELERAAREAARCHVGRCGRRARSGGARSRHRSARRDRSGAAGDRSLPMTAVPST